MKIVALKYGASVYGESFIFKGGSQDNLLPISFVIYLIQTENRNILVDVGCDDGAGFLMSIFKKPVEVLLDYGLTPEAITDIVITHAHHDHIEAISYYNNALIHIQTNEYLQAKRYIPEGFKVHLFDTHFSLDDNILVLKIGGHSTGSSIVLADKYVLCGDECYYHKNLTDHIMTGASVDEEKSALFIKQYSNKVYTPLLFHDPQILEGKVGYVSIHE